MAKRTSLVLFLLLALCAVSWGGGMAAQHLPDDQQIPSAEYEALVALWTNTGGPSWNVTWTFPTDRPCDLPRVRCSGGHVTGLELGEAGLTGALPAQITDLTCLTSLAIYRTDLGGEIPPELGGMAQLGELVLSENDLTGGIPPELGQLSELHTLYLRSNELTGPLPASLGNLRELAVLNVRNNPLSGRLPRTLTQLSDLAEFDGRGTDLCEPQNATFQAWAAGVADYEGPPEDCWDCVVCLPMVRR